MIATHVCLSCGFAVRRGTTALIPLPELFWMPGILHISMPVAQHRLSGVGRDLFQVTSTTGVRTGRSKRNRRHCAIGAHFFVACRGKKREVYIHHHSGVTGEIDIVLRSITATPHFILFLPFLKVVYNIERKFRA